MITTSQNLSSGLEDYIETIYISLQSGENLKGAELARRLFISRASVSEALSKLVNLGLIEYESYGYIKLTEIGIKEGKRVYSKHGILKDFFKNILGINEKEASENACEIEHVISQNVLERLTKFSKFCKENPNLIEKFKKESLI
ncbi:metal-dependent transcriptional regulator [bacterium]|nr:metal-dependent transcriptional regulator [bacterium]